MRNTRKSGQILRSKKRPRPTLRSGRGSRTNFHTSHQIPARVIEANSVRAVRVPDSRSVQLIQLGAAAAVITVRSIGSLPTARLSALPTLLLTIKRHLHILRHAKHHWQIPLRAEKSPRCDRTARFLASYFEFVDCNFIKEPRPNVAKGHERIFLRTLLSNIPTICNRQRIADSIAGFFVDRYLAFKRCTRRGPNKSVVIYPHPIP